MFKIGRQVSRLLQSFLLTINKLIARFYIPDLAFDKMYGKHGVLLVFGNAYKGWV
jgi:hypothetical protein